MNSSVAKAPPAYTTKDHAPARVQSPFTLRRSFSSDYVREIVHSHSFISHSNEEPWQSYRPSHQPKISQSAIAAIIAETQSLASHKSSSHISSIIFHTTPTPSLCESPASKAPTKQPQEAVETAKDAPRSFLASLRARWQRSEPQLRTHMGTPVEFIHTLGPYTYVYASLSPHNADDIAWRVRTQREWRDQYDRYLIAYGVQGAACAVLPPYYVYQKDDGPSLVFQIREAHQEPLRVGSEIECFGMLEGRWTLAPYVTRRHRMRFISKHQPEEWVYVLMRQEETRQETWLKMPASAFYPTTWGISTRKTVQKLGQLIAQGIQMSQVKNVYHKVRVQHTSSLTLEKEEKDVKRKRHLAELNPGQLT
ncbi:hypothetical protein R3P38DRAFT_2780496 [Favolaschia claudopus]|uniref:Uncharacterized protein n=1 Tax=Favolaschia claudopus TaxID=2862362 RepID=A0AAW0B9V4_9AGAR